MIDLPTLRDFSDIYKNLDYLKLAVEESCPTVTIDQACSNLKDALNRFLPDFRCNQVKFTSNTDKCFFGVWVCPVGLSSQLITIKVLEGLIDGSADGFSPFKDNAYTLELDGKLFRQFNLSLQELWAIIFGEINAMNSTTPYEKLRNMIDAYISLHGTHICSDSVHATLDIFAMVAKITMHNLTSIFERHDFMNMVESPDIVAGYNLTYEYQSALTKLVNAGAKAPDTDLTGLMLSWYFNNYTNIKNSRWIQVMLRDAMSTEASYTVKNMIRMALELTNGDACYYAQSITESKKGGLIWHFKRNGIKSIEEDLYEYNMRLRNVETQDEAILLMRQINSRMSILEDYLREEEMDEADKKRWEACYQGYVDVRTALSKKTVYNRKMYGLFVDYNALQNMSNSGQLMNTYY